MGHWLLRLAGPGRHQQKAGADHHVVGAEEVFAPASNCVNPSLFAVSPTPSWPSSLRPQVHACPAAVTAIVCDARSRKHPLRHPRQPPPRLLVAEARESPPQM